MKLFGRQVNNPLSLARPKPTNLDTEKGGGASGGSKLGFDYAAERKSPKQKDYQHMLDTDGTAEGLNNMMVQPILATDFHIQPADEDQGPNDTHPQADFINDVFTRPPHQGGMTTPFSLVIDQMLRAISEGWIGFELVWTLSKEGQVVLRKMAVRDFAQVDIRTDDHSGFDGFDATDPKGKQVVIPVEDSFLFTFGRRRDPLRGRSAFRAAYVAYDRKRRYKFIVQNSAQIRGTGIKQLKAPAAAGPKDRDENLRAVDALGLNASIVLPAGWDLDLPAMTSPMDLLPYIDSENAEMTRSVLAQFMLLGNQSKSSGGSYSLSENQSGMFMQALEGVMGSIEEHINSYVIPKLIDFNFDKPAYPKFKFNNMSDKTVQAITTAFTALVQSANQEVPEHLVEGIFDKMGNQLGIDKPDDAPPPGPALSSGKKKASLANKKWWRALSPAENKVDLSGIERKFNQLDADFVLAAKPIFDTIRRDAIKRITPLIESGDVKALNSFSLKFGPDYVAAVTAQMMEAYTYAKTGAADELTIAAPANRQKSKDLIKQYATNVVDKQLQDLNFELKNVITQATRKNQLSNPSRTFRGDGTETTPVNLSLGDVLASITAAFNDFFDSKIAPTASVAMTLAVNIGRDDVFQAISGRINLYQYSAILDSKVCPICEDLDGSVVDESEYMSTQWMPPIHFYCRCIWVAILDDEEDPPEITGFPSLPGGAEAPSLSQHSCTATHLKRTIKS